MSRAQRYASDWESDRIAWQLTDAQHRHYLWRLHDYHSTLWARRTDEATRFDRQTRWLGFVALTLLALILLSEVAS